MQGWRISMEDAHAAVLNLSNDPATSPAGRTSFFAVYDGHGGMFVRSRRLACVRLTQQAQMSHGTLDVRFTRVFWHSLSSRKKTGKQPCTAPSSRLMKICVWIPCMQMTRPAAQLWPRSLCRNQDRREGACMWPTQATHVACWGLLARPSP